MPGMMNQMGGYSAGVTAFAAAPVSSPATTNTSIFGPQPGSDTGSAGSVLGALNPLKAFGLTVWSGVIAVALLALIRHSLPA